MNGHCCFFCGKAFFTLVAQAFIIIKLKTEINFQMEGF